MKNAKKKKNSNLASVAGTKDTFHLQRTLLKVDTPAKAREHEANRLFLSAERKELKIVDPTLFEMSSLTFIVGEAGIGKTKILEHLSGAKATTSVFVIVNLRALDSSADLLTLVLETKPEGFHFSVELTSSNEDSVVLLLDGLDEVSQADVLNVHRNITLILEERPNWRIIVTSRTAVLERYWGLFAEKKPIIWQVSHLADQDVLDYMRMSGVAEVLTERAKEWLRLDRGTSLVSIPRYLNYICEYLLDPRNKDQQNIPRISEIFQSVIDRELKHEISRKGLLAHSRIIERLLAKLALVMEIAQTNSIKADELLTFFDNVGSDLKIPFLEPGRFAELTEQILKFDGVKYEFQNRELQEFLAATEVIRLSSPQRIIFSLCYDEESKILKPSWFNCLRFAFDLMPQLFADLVPFLVSAAHRPEGGTFYTLDESFWKTAPIFRDSELTIDLAERLYDSILSYFRDSLFWIEYDAVFSLASLYRSSFEVKLLELKDNIGSTKTHQKVHKSNLARLIGEIRNTKGYSAFSFDWQSWLRALIKDLNEDPVVVRTSLWALRYFEDESVLADLDLLVGSSDQSIPEAVVQVCAAHIGNPKAISIALKLFEIEVIGSFEALMKSESKQNQIRIIEEFAANSMLADKFLQQLDYETSRKEGFLPRILTKQIEDDQVCAAVQSLIATIVPLLGMKSRIHTEIYDITQRFSEVNSSIVEAVSRGLSETEDLDTSWAIESGLPYFITESNKQIVLTIIENSKLAERKSTLVHSLKFQISRFENFSKQVQQTEKVKTKESVVVLDEVLSTKLKDFKKGTHSYSIFEELLRFLEKIRREETPLREEDSRIVIDSVQNNIFNEIDPQEGRLSLNTNVSHRSYNISSFINLFSIGVQICSECDANILYYRDKFLSYLPFAESEELEWLVKQIGLLSTTDESIIVDRFVNDLAFKTIKISNLVYIAPLIRDNLCKTKLIKLVTDSAVDEYERCRLITTFADLQISESEINSLEASLKKSKDPNKEKILTHINALLISHHRSRKAIADRIKGLLKRAGTVPARREGIAFLSSDFESELLQKTFAKPLLTVADPNVMDLFFRLLESAFKLAESNDKLVRYSVYLWDIVIKYFENLLTLRSYTPLRQLEQEIAKYFKRERANWIQEKLASLRNSYSNSLGKPSTFHGAVKAYNQCREAANLQVVNSLELKQRILDCLSQRISTWLSGEGKKIVKSAYRSTNQKEVELQRIIKLMLVSELNRGLTTTTSFSIVREPQLDDDTRTDLLVSYGFVGPVLVELKLSGHPHLGTKKLRQEKSYISVSQYMRGYNCTAGIFLILKNKTVSIQRENRIRAAYADISGLSIFFSDLPSNLIKKSKKRKITKSMRKKSTRGARRRRR